MRTLKEIRDLIADGKLTEAAAAAVQYAEASGDTETLNGLIALQGDLSRHHTAWLTGQLSFEESHREQARMTHHLLGRLESLPDAPNPKAARSRIPEPAYKWWMFGLFSASKLLVFGFAAFVWQVEGVMQEEAMTLFNALLPGLIIYGTLMFRHLLRSDRTGGPRRYVSGRFRTLLWIVFPAYVLLQVFIIYQKAVGNFTFAAMNLAILASEAGFGRFISEVVEELFQKKEMGNRPHKTIKIY